MAEQDTIRLLRECDAGIKMGVDSIQEVLPKVKSQKLKDRLESCKREHEKLDKKLQKLLQAHHDEGKEPNLMAKGMSQLKTMGKMALDPSDQTIADLMTDGCNMGVKTLHQFLNQFKAASQEAKEITKALINVEEGLVMEIREFL